MSSREFSLVLIKQLSRHESALGLPASSTSVLPDPLLLGLLQLSVPLQHAHDGPLLLLRQVAQVNHGSSSQLPQQAGVEALRGGQSQPADSVAVRQVRPKVQYVDTTSVSRAKHPLKQNNLKKKPSAWMMHRGLSYTKLLSLELFCS